MPLLIISLTACGGGTESESTTDSQSSNAQQQYNDPLSLNATQLSAIGEIAFPTITSFNEWNRGVRDTPSSVNTRFGGGMFVKIGAEETYLHGVFDILIDFTTGFGRGSINSLYLTGADIAEDGLVGFLDELAITVTSVSGSDIQGTIIGVFEDDVFQNQPFVEQVIVDSTFDGRFVETGGLIGFVGVVSGTLSSSAFAAKTFTGILAAQDTLF